LGYLQKANGSWSDSSKESSDLLINVHFPGSQQTGHPPERRVGDGIELYPLLSDRNMKWSIHSFKPYKSPGPYGIIPAHIQQAGKLAINWLKKNLLLQPGGRRTSNSMARNESGFHSQSREGHPYIKTTIDPTQYQR